MVERLGLVVQVDAELNLFRMHFFDQDIRDRRIHVAFVRLADASG